MPKTLVDCGNCGPDYNSIRQMVSSQFGAKVIQTHGTDDTLEALKGHDVALITVNRKLDRDYSDGMEVLRAIKADPNGADVPVMIVTNYDEHQQAAVEAGAVRGFGKLELSNPATKELLQPYLGT